VNQLKSCEDSLSARCGKFVRQAQAAPYQQDKALSRTRVSWFHLHTEREEVVMKSYRNAAALIMALALSTSALAGEIQTGFTDPPPPTANSTAQTTTTDGEIQTGAAETLTQIALNVLTALPSLP
jgi:hypothetical protein